MADLIAWPCGGLILTGRLDHPADARFLAAWSEGATACLRGDALSANPYVPDTVSGWGWQSGWTELDPLISAMAATDRQGPTP